MSASLRCSTVSQQIKAAADPERGLPQNKPAPERGNFVLSTSRVIAHQFRVYPNGQLVLQAKPTLKHDFNEESQLQFSFSYPRCYPLSPTTVSYSKKRGI